MYITPHELAIRLQALRQHIGEGTGNNYAYLVSDEKTKDAVIIDPANPPEYVRMDFVAESDI